MKKQTKDNWQAEDCENYDDSRDVCLDAMAIGETTVISGDRITSAEVVAATGNGQRMWKVMKERPEILRVWTRVSGPLELTIFRNSLYGGKPNEFSIQFMTTGGGINEGTGGAPHISKALDLASLKKAIAQMEAWMKKNGKKYLSSHISGYELTGDNQMKKVKL